MNSIHPVVRALALSILLAFLSFIPLGVAHASVSSPRPASKLVHVQPPEPEAEPWETSIAKIEAARHAGALSTSEAARLRWLAISDWQQLPPSYQPQAPSHVISAPQDRNTSSKPRTLPAPGASVPLHAHPNSSEAGPTDGMVQAAARMAAVFSDHTEWDSATTEAIYADMEQAQQQELVSLNLNITSTHFVIHWAANDDDLPDGCETTACSYARAISDSLELSWREFENYGYNMPPPMHFGKEKIDVYIQPVVTVCGASYGDAEEEDKKILGMSWPGDIYLRSDQSNHDVLLPLATHELYHQVQWYYVGFSGNGCGSWISPWLWYHTGSAWLMEATATWIEHEVYPTRSREPGATYRGALRLDF
ncbi:MAG: hypothetical protein H0T73_04795 [Ardenticatenales bacterium]|nr:hypothetical protein [Ardenticatenales bacterium]